MRRRGVDRFADLTRDAPQKRAHVVDAAGAEIGVEFFHQSRAATVEKAESRSSGLSSPGRTASFTPASPADVAQALEPIAPVIEAAEAAHEHELRARRRLLRVEIHRERMAELLQAGEAQARKRRRVPAIRRRRAR